MALALACVSEHQFDLNPDSDAWTSAELVLVRGFPEPPRAHRPGVGRGHPLVRAHHVGRGSGPAKQVEDLSGEASRGRLGPSIEGLRACASSPAAGRSVLAGIAAPFRPLGRRLRSPDSTGVAPNAGESGVGGAILCRSDMRSASRGPLHSQDARHDGCLVQFHPAASRASCGSLLLPSPFHPGCLRAADVLVVTDSRHPVQSAAGARVIELDLPERIEAELAASVQRSPAVRQRSCSSACAMAARPCSAGSESAYQGVADAWGLGIAKVPPWWSIAATWFMATPT